MGQLVEGGWTLEQSDALREFILNGLTYSESAVKINEKFGTDKTRNAAIGRANRIGLQCPKKEGRPSQRSPRPYTPRPKKPRPVIESPEVIQARCEEIIPKNLMLLQLGPRHCRYPYGDAVVTFCGKKSLKGLPYCPSHQLLCYRPDHHKGATT